MNKSLISFIGILFSLLTISPIIIEAQLTGYPTPDIAPKAEPKWSKLVDLSTVSKIPVRTLGACDPTDPYCTWSCTTCSRPETDVIQCPTANDWALTYDDGPSPFTPGVLDHLKAKGIKGTFFVIGSRVLSNPDVLKRVYAEGHQVAIHTWSHTPLTTQTSEVVIAELKWTEQIIKEVIGVTPKWYRPPQGDFDDRIRHIAKSLGYKAAIWDLDTFDWKSNADPTFDLNWITGNFTEWAKNKTTGHMSLEHDLYEKTAGMAPKAMDIAIAAGFNFKDVSTCTNSTSYLESNATSSTTSSSATPKSNQYGTSVSSSSSSTGSPSNKSSDATRNNNNNFFVSIICAIIFSIIFF